MRVERQPLAKLQNNAPPRVRVSRVVYNPKAAHDFEVFSLSLSRYEKLVWH